MSQAQIQDRIIAQLQVGGMTKSQLFDSLHPHSFLASNFQDFQRAFDDLIKRGVIKNERTIELPSVGQLSTFWLWELAEKG